MQTQTIENLKQLLSSFSFESLKCPFCETGFLKVDEKEFLLSTTPSSQKLDELIGDTTQLISHFTAILKCNNPICFEISTVSGLIRMVEDGYWDGHDEETGEYITHPQQKFKRIYIVKYFSPSIHFIFIPVNVPNLIQEELIKSFELFWSDKASCMNKLRCALECLLDTLKVRKTTTHRNGKRVKLKLHQRLQKCKASKYNSLLSNFFAIKDLGNEGSHYNKNVSLSDLIDCYQIFENLLTKIFDKTERNVSQTIKKVIKRYRRENEIQQITATS